MEKKCAVTKSCLDFCGELDEENCETKIWVCEWKNNKCVEKTPCKSVQEKEPCKKMVDRDNNLICKWKNKKNKCLLKK